MKRILFLILLVLLAAFAYFHKTNEVDATFNWITCHKYADNKCVQNNYQNHCPTFWSNGSCPAPSPTPSATPSPTPTDDCEDEECVLPSPSPSPTVEATPSAHFDTTNHNSAGSGSGEAHNPSCHGTPAKAPILTFNGSDSGCATWHLNQSDNYDKAVFSYGYSESNLQFGVPDLGSPDHSKDFTICGLTPGNNIWGQVNTVRDDCSSLSSKVDPVIN